MTPDDWLVLLNSIMKDVTDFAAMGDYRLAGALDTLAVEARRAAVTVRAAKPHRRGKILVSLSESAPVD